MTAQELLKANLDDLGARERILKTALVLFSQKGVHRTGTDLIIEKSGVAKMTFYRLFKTKAGLVTEYLRLRDEEWFALLRRHIDAHKAPKERALALFDGLKEWFKEPEFTGCPFLRGLYDFTEADDDPEILTEMQKHFQKLQGLVVELVRAVKPKDYQKIVPQFVTLVAGSIIVAQVSKSPDIAIANKNQAKNLLG